MASRFSSRIQVIALVAWHSLLTLGRRKPPANPRHILIAHHLRLGDTLMLTPLLAKLHEQYPAAEIIMATPKAVAPLYQHQPYGVLAVPYDPRDPATFQALRKLRGFDLAIVPGDNRHSWLACALGAKWIIAHAGDRPAYKSWPVDQLAPYSGTPAAWGDMVAELVKGLPPAAYQPQAWPTPECKPFTLPPAPYCVLHVGASSPLKFWDAEKWRALAAHLKQQGYNVVWSGGPGEQQLIDTLDPEARYPSYADQFDLPQLWNLVSKASLLVSPDTGVAHLGRLVNTPTVTLFGPGSAVICGAGNFWRNSPYRAVTVNDFPCRNQHVLFKRKIAWVSRCAKTTKECASAACMQAITLDEVIGAASSLWNSITPGR